MDWNLHFRARLYRIAEDTRAAISKTPEATLLARLQRHTAELLFGDRIISLPRSFLSSSFHLAHDCSLKTILKEWNCDNLHRYRDQAVDDLDAAEWSAALQITQQVLNAKPHRTASSAKRYPTNQRIIWNAWLASPTHLITHCRSRKDAHLIALRVAEAIAREIPFCITSIHPPPNEQPGARWWQTRNHAVPKIRFNTDGSITWLFAKEETLRKLKAFCGLP